MSDKLQFVAYVAFKVRRYRQTKVCRTSKAYPASLAAALLCECPVGGPNIMLAALTSRETDCYSWHDSMVRHTLVDTARSKAKPSALGSLSPETKLPVNLRLIVLCGVESFPGADGLLNGQGSYRTIRPDHIRPLLFQNYI